MGASQDSKAKFARLLVNASYWAIGMEDKIPAKSDVDIVVGTRRARSRAAASKG